MAKEDRMHPRRPSRRIWSWLAFLAVAALVASACGQKAGVHLSAGGGGAGGGGGENGDLSAGGPGGDSGTGTGGTGSGGSTLGGSTGGSGGTSGGGAAGPGNSTGVTDDTILIGIHAPATGAGAPQASFDAGKDKYFTFIGKTINGRQVKVAFEDDGYNPGQAVAACKKLVQQDKVFLLVGGGGTDQIVACAQYAASVGVPYLAEGVTEQGLDKLQSYFAVSMTYRAQAKLLAQYMKNVLKVTKVGMIRGNTANFDDAHAAFLAAAQ